MIFYYVAIKNEKVIAIFKVKDVAGERFNQAKRERENLNPGVKFVLVPEELNPLAKYAIELGRKAQAEEAE